MARLAALVGVFPPPVLLLSGRCFRTISELTWIMASDFQECSLFVVDCQRHVDPCLAATYGAFDLGRRGPIDVFGAFW